MAKEFKNMLEGGDGVKRLEILMVAMNIVLEGHREILLALAARVKKLEGEGEK